MCTGSHCRPCGDHIIHHEHPLPAEATIREKSPRDIGWTLLRWQGVLHARRSRATQPRPRRPLEPLRHGCREHVGRACPPHHAATPVHGHGHHEVGRWGRAEVGVNLVAQTPPQGQSHRFSRRPLGPQHSLPHEIPVRRKNDRPPPRKRMASTGLAVGRFQRVTAGRPAAWAPRQARRQFCHTRRTEIAWGIPLIAPCVWRRQGPLAEQAFRWKEEVCSSGREPRQRLPHPVSRGSGDGLPANPD